MKVRKYEDGASFTELGGSMDIVGGVVKGIYGIKQLQQANTAYERARAAAPSLDTPAQFYENYRNAYDSALARIETDAIQGNLSSSIEALQGAGGRALVGGLTAAVAQSENSQNRMLAQERAARMQAGQQLAVAEERAIQRKEYRSQNEMLMAQQAAAAARQNIVSGVTDVATGLLAGGAKPFVDAGKSLIEKGKSAYEQYQDKRVAKDWQKRKLQMGSIEGNLNLQQFVQNQQELFSGRNKIGEIDFGFQRPQATFAEETFDRAAAMRTQFELDQRSTLTAPRKSTIVSGYGEPGQYTQEQRVVLGNMPPELRFNTERQTNVDPTTYWEYPNPYYIPQGSNLDKSKVLFGIESVPGTYKDGGMVTPGNFSHGSNPIDLVRNGVKIAEATGNEYIINPEQAKKISEQSPYAKRLFKQFMKRANK